MVWQREKCRRPAQGLLVVDDLEPDPERLGHLVAESQVGEGGRLQTVDHRRVTPVVVSKRRDRPGRGGGGRSSATSRRTRHAAAPHQAVFPSGMGRPCLSASFPVGDVDNLCRLCYRATSCSLCNSNQKGGDTHYAGQCPRQQCRPGAPRAEKEAPGRRRVPRNEASAAFREAVRKARASKGRGDPPGPEARAEKGAARRYALSDW